MTLSNVRLFALSTALAGLSAFSVSAARAQLSVESWSLATGVYDSEAKDDYYDGSVILTVQNPLKASHGGMIGNSFATATYDIGWIIDEANYDVSFSQHLAQLSGDTGAEGRIYLTPSVNSTITAWGTFEYSWPDAALGTAIIDFTVVRADGTQRIIDEFDHGGNVGLDPPFGTLNVDGSGILRAGRQYFIHYLVRVYHIDPTLPGTYGEASGEIHFNITPVPEPASLALLTLPLALSRRRRHKRRRPF